MAIPALTAAERRRIYISLRRGSRTRVTDHSVPTAITRLCGVLEDRPRDRRARPVRQNDLDAMGTQCLWQTRSARDSAARIPGGVPAVLPAGTSPVPPSVRHAPRRQPVNAL